MRAGYISVHGSPDPGSRRLLKGKRATTHCSATQELAKFADIEVAQERFVHEVNVSTSAGISAGIDMALYIVEEHFSEKLAKKVANRLEWAGD